MNSTLATSFLHLSTPSLSSSSSSSSSVNSTSQLPHHPHSINLHHPQPTISIPASSPNPPPSLIIQRLKSFAKTAVLIAASASAATHFVALHPARAESPAAVAEQTTLATEEEEQEAQNEESNKASSFYSPLSKFLDGNSEAVESVKSLLQHKLQSGEGEEALKILGRLVSSQPSVTEWKFMLARAYGQMGQTKNARQVFEEILASNPLSFEALSENAVLMEKCGEGDAAILRLESALEVAEEENRVKEARDVRMIMAQVHFLQKNMEEALKIYQQLSKEDPVDFRPYYCKGVIYSLLNKNEEAKEQYAKYRELSPKKGEMDHYLRSPSSRMMELRSSDDNRV